MSGRKKEAEEKTISKEEVIRKLRDNMDKIRSFGVKKIGIFGSVARGKATEKSDIDIIVEFEEKRKNFENFIELAFFLEELLGKKVDLLTPESISPYIQPYIKVEVIDEGL